MTASRERNWCGVSLPKDGMDTAECEDAFAASATGARFTVVDGASEGCFTARWARLLADRFIAAPPTALSDRNWIEPAQAAWAAAVDPLTVPWYLEEKREQGAFATFIGLEIAPGRWQVAAVGDSCLFHVRQGRLIRAFPLTVAGAFNNHPNLIPARAAHGPPVFQTAAGRTEPGDWLFLVSDALAEWSLRQAEQGRPVWDNLAAVCESSDPEPEFAGLIARWRASGMKNDDVTLLGVSL